MTVVKVIFSAIESFMMLNMVPFCTFAPNSKVTVSKRIVGFKVEEGAPKPSTLYFLYLYYKKLAPSLNSLFLIVRPFTVREFISYGFISKRFWYPTVLTLVAVSSSWILNVSILILLK